MKKSVFMLVTILVALIYAGNMLVSSQGLPARSTSTARLITPRPTSTKTPPITSTSTESPLPARPALYVPARAAVALWVRSGPGYDWPGVFVLAKGGWVLAIPECVKGWAALKSGGWVNSAWLNWEGCK